MLRNSPPNLTDWYWRADDGRIYGSRSGLIVADTDPDYRGWAAGRADDGADGGATATVWPTDANGVQSNAALVEVLAFYSIVPGAGLVTSTRPSVAALIAHARDARYARETAGVATSLGPIATDDRSKVMILGAMLAAQGDPSWATIWSFDDGTVATIDRAGIGVISTAAQAHVNAVFGAFARVKSAIEATPPSITTFAEIDAAFAAMTE